MSKKYIILNQFQIDLLIGVSQNFINKIKDYEQSKSVPKHFRENLLLVWGSINKKLKMAVNLNENEELNKVIKS